MHKGCFVPGEAIVLEADIVNASSQKIKNVSYLNDICNSLIWSIIIVDPKYVYTIFHLVPSQDHSMVSLHRLP